MTKPRNPRSALRVEISRCRSLLAAIEDAQWPDESRIPDAVALVSDAKNALNAAHTTTLPPKPKGRY